MKVKDYMTQEVCTVVPDKRLTDVVSLMQQHDFHRLPVVDDRGKYLGLITADIISNHTPSSASSLSIYEMNYLLDKITAGELMNKEAGTIGEEASIEEAAAKMHDNRYTVLTVLNEENYVIGIITDKDIFEALIELTGYRQPGARVEVFVKEGIGVLAGIAQTLAEANIAISHVFISDRQADRTSIIVQTEDPDGDSVIQALQDENYAVELISRN